MPRCRPFKIADAMILIANAAFGMASMRTVWVQFRTFWAGIKMDPNLQAYAGIVQTALTIALLNLAVAYVWMRLIPPRPPLPDLIRQPGLLVLILLIASSLLFLALFAFAAPGAWMNRIVALALGLSWVAACYRYRSRAEPGWIENLGRFFGVGLVFAVAAS